MTEIKLPLTTFNLDQAWELASGLVIDARINHLTGVVEESEKTLASFADDSGVITLNYKDGDPNTNSKIISAHKKRANALNELNKITKNTSETTDNANEFNTQYSNRIKLPNEAHLTNEILERNGSGINIVDNVANLNDSQVLISYKLDSETPVEKVVERNGTDETKITSRTDPGLQNEILELSPGNSINLDARVFNDNGLLTNEQGNVQIINNGNLIVDKTKTDEQINELDETQGGKGKNNQKIRGFDFSKEEDRKFAAALLNLSVEHYDIFAGMGFGAGMIIHHQKRGAASDLIDNREVRYDDKRLNILMNEAIESNPNLYNAYMSLSDEEKTRLYRDEAPQFGSKSQEELVNLTHQEKLNIAITGMLKDNGGLDSDGQLHDLYQALGNDEYITSRKRMYTLHWVPNAEIKS